jgi:molybdopterin-guanine dinucleotide biosynthesis protein A
VDVTGIILAGGKGSRLGREKVFEKLGGQYLIWRVLEQLSPLCQDIIVVTSPDLLDPVSRLGLKGKVVGDIYPGKAALGGLYTGLKATQTKHNIVVACDMPFLNRNLLLYMYSQASGYDAVVPLIDGMLEPLHCIYSTNCIGVIKQLLDEKRLGVLQIFTRITCKYIDEDTLNKFDPERLSFFNINTQADYEKAELILNTKDDLREIERDCIVGDQCRGSITKNISFC